MIKHTEKLNALIKVLCLSISLTSVVYAEPIHMRYKDIYDQEKYNKDFSKVAISHYLYQQGRQIPCLINESWMENKDQSEDISIAPDGQILLPLDDNLKQVNPDLIFLTDQECVLSIEIRAKLDPTTQILASDSIEIVTQMQKLMKDMVGFVNYFNPKIKGLTVHFSPELKEKPLFFLVKQTDVKAIQLPRNFYKITPWFEN